MTRAATVAERAATETYTLTRPIMVSNETIAAVTIRRPKARDMIEIADHVPVIIDFAQRSQAAVEAANGDAQAAGLAVVKHLNRATYEAMVAIARNLADLGDAALELDSADLTPIALGALNLMGE